MSTQAAVLRLEVAPTDSGGFETGERLQAWLTSVDCSSDTADDARLVVDELVDNAIRHVHATALVTIVFDDHRLRIDVRDTSSSPPVLATPSAANGFGLLIVEALSDTWGWERTEHGKRVWAEILC